MLRATHGCLTAVECLALAVAVSRSFDEQEFYQEYHGEYRVNARVNEHDGPTYYLSLLLDWVFAESTPAEILVPWIV